MPNENGTTKDWPHTPVHRLDSAGVYMVTAATLQRSISSKQLRGGRHLSESCSRWQNDMSGSSKRGPSSQIIITSLVGSLRVPAI